jgi:gliding motility-associated-like protein
MPIPTLTLSPNASICQGVSSSVTLTANGASVYTWINSSSLSSSTGSAVVASPNATTIYTVTGITASCSNTAAITVSVNPSPTITAVSFTNTTCGLNNGSATVTSSPSNNTYTWSSGINSTTNSAVSLASGIYTVTATNGSCQTSSVVNILSSIPLLITSTTITPSDCNVNNGSIAVIDNYINSNYSWSPNLSSNNTLNNLAPANYALTITNGACSTSSVFVITQLSGPTALNVNQNNAICESFNGSINIISVVNGIAPYQYNFNNIGFSSVSTYSNLAQGIYTISVKDAHSCLYAQTFSIIKSLTNLTFDLITNLPSCDNNDGSLIINKFTSGTPPYLTSFNNGVYSGNLIFDQLSVGTYSLSIRDSNMCVTGYVLTLKESGDYTLYVPNTFSPNNDERNDFWYAKGTCLLSYNCLIFNRWGEKIIELKDIDEKWDGTYKGKSVPEGVYV